MFDSQKIDNYFSEQPQQLTFKLVSKPNRRKRVMTFVKLALPSLAALLTGFLIVIPQLKKNLNDVAAEVITPNKSELEKFHMEKSVFYITDYKNMVNNFNADTLDETEAGSKIIKMINPRGTIPTAAQDEVKIKSPLGFYDQNTKMLRLTDGVNIEYSEGLTTDTAEMFVDFNTGKAYGNTPIVTTAEKAKITAQGFEYYKDKNLLIYTGKSHINIQSDAAEGGF